MASVSGRRARVTFDYEPEQLDELRLTVGDIVEEVQDEDEGWCKGTLNGKVGLFPNNFVEFLPDSKAPVEAKTDSSPPKDALFGKKAKVNFEYDAENEDELQLDVGDVVDVLREVEDGWWEGSLNGHTGVFPSNFVTLVEDEKPNPPLPKREPVMAETAPESVPKNKQLIDEEDGSKRLSFMGKMGGGMGFGNLMSADVLSNVKLKKVDKKVPEPEEKTSAADQQLPVAGLKKTPGNSFKRKAPPIPPTPVAPQVLMPAKKPVGKAKVLFEYEPENDDELSLNVGDIVKVLNKQVQDTDGWWEGEVNGKIGLFPDNFVELLPNEEEPPLELPPKSPKRVPPAPVTGQDKRTPPPTPLEQEHRTTEPPRKEMMKKSVEPKKPPPPKSEIETKPSLPIKKPVPPKPSTKPSVLPKKPLPKPPIGKSVPPKPSSTREPEVKREIPMHRTTKTSSEMMEGDSISASSSEGCNLDVVEPHETLQQLTVNRAKLQSKRPPSSTRHSEGNLLDTSARQEPEGEREEKPIKAEPKEPAWKREARELREAKELKDKVVPPVPSNKEKKPLIFEKREEKTKLTEFRKSVELPTKTSDVSSADEVNSLRQEVSELKAMVEMLKGQMTTMKTNHEEDYKKLEKRMKSEIEQLTEDFDEQRNKFAKLEIDFDRLKKRSRRGSQDADD